MFRKKKYRDVIVQFIKFSIVGISNTVLGLGVYYILLFFSVHYLIANIISGIVSIFNAYYWNNRYVFSGSNAWIKTLMRTYLSYGMSFLLTTILLWIFVEKCLVSQLVAPILTLFITTPLNFLMNKFWTFK